MCNYRYNDSSKIITKIKRLEKFGIKILKMRQVNGFLLKLLIQKGTRHNYMLNDNIIYILTFMI